MSRQLEMESEVRATAKRDALVRALDFGIVGALEAQGIDLLSFSVRPDPFSCLITIRAVVDAKQCVAFVGSDTIINALLKLDLEATHARLHWGQDKYAKKQI